MKLAKKLRSNKGFTLVELVVVIAVLAILAGVGSVAYSGYITRAKEATDMSTLAAIQTAVVSACAEKGAVTSIKVSNAGDFVTATAGGSDVVLRGTGEDATLKANFDTFIGSNSLKLTSEKFSTGAQWSSQDPGANTWVKPSSAITNPSSGG